MWTSLTGFEQIGREGGWTRNSYLWDFTTRGSLGNGLDCNCDTFTQKKEKLNFLLVTLLFLWFERDLDGAALLVLWNFLDFGGVFLSITVSENITQ